MLFRSKLELFALWQKTDLVPFASPIRDLPHRVPEADVGASGERHVAKQQRGQHPGAAHREQTKDAVLSEHLAPPPTLFLYLCLSLSCSLPLTAFDPTPSPGLRNRLAERTVWCGREGPPQRCTSLYLAPTPPSPTQPQVTYIPVTVWGDPSLVLPLSPIVRLLQDSRRFISH